MARSQPWGVPWTARPTAETPAPTSLRRRTSWTTRLSVLPSARAICSAARARSGGNEMVFFTAFIKFCPLDRRDGNNHTPSVVASP